MSVIREIESSGWRFRFELASQILSLDVPDFSFGFRDEASPLLATMPLDPSGLVSAAALLLKAKQFDDGLYAAVEVAAQRGAQRSIGPFVGKASFLRSLANSVPIFVACRLGNVPVHVPDSLAESVRDAVDRFLADEALSKPMGFYTWSEELRAIFRQDRFLQQALPDDQADALFQAIQSTPGGMNAYKELLELTYGMTNPTTSPDVRSSRPNRAFLPASRSHEQMLVEKLFADRPIPDGFDLMDELIRRVKSGELSLKPDSDSGWYDRQTWSIEALLRPGTCPEKARLKLGRGYQEHLDDLFRSTLALARETHVKQAMLGAAGGLPPPAMKVRPQLTVEPLPTMYSRRADSYRFVRSVLYVAFGSSADTMHRLTADGPVEATLAHELADMTRLFDGAAAAAKRELGIEAPDDGTAKHFAEWRIASDPDLSKDARMMVPVFYDRGRQKMKVWVFLGWKTLPLTVGYEKPPKLVDRACAEADAPVADDRLSQLRRKFRKTEKRSPEPPEIRFESAGYRVATPVMAEAYVTQLLDRDEFRRHCDRYASKDRIVSNLR
jgi:hypothetical protein